MLTVIGGNFVLKRVAVTVLLFAFFVVVGARSASAGSFPGLNGRIGYENGYPTGAIDSVLPDGSSPKTLLAGPVSGFHFSADGKKVVFDNTGVSVNTISSQNLDGSNLRQLYSSDSDGANAPTFSPDGSKVLFTRTVGGTYVLTVMNADGTNLVNITSAYSILANWSPDGSKIVFLGWNGQSDVYTVNADGTNLQQLTGSDYYDWDPTWSPDGTKIAYRTVNGSGIFQIFIMNADGTNKVQLTNSADHNYSMAWSPDGTKIAFVRQASANDIYVVNADGSNETKIVSGVENINNIDWQPLTTAPSSDTPNPDIAAGSDGTATVDIPSLYSDAYDGIDESSVTVTSTPSSGTTSVDENGVITYRQDGFAKTKSASKVLAALFPVGAAHAQGGSDSFTYKVCSLSNASLCATGTVTVTLASATSGAGLADTGQSTALFSLIGTTLVAAALLAIKRRSKTI